MYASRNPQRIDTFPPVDEANDEGLLAIGGDLSPERLLLAYRSGIFPWFEDGFPVLWWSPDPRAIIQLDELHVSRRLARTLRGQKFELTLNQAFERVVRGGSLGDAEINIRVSKRSSVLGSNLNAIPGSKEYLGDFSPRIGFRCAADE